MIVHSRLGDDWTQGIDWSTTKDEYDAEQQQKAAETTPTTGGDLIFWDSNVPVGYTADTYDKYLKQTTGQGSNPSSSGPGFLDTVGGVFSKLFSPGPTVAATVVQPAIPSWVWVVVPVVVGGGVMVMLASSAKKSPMAGYRRRRARR